MGSASSSSRKWATSISSFASRLFFLLIILQLPLFRVPCGCGICTTPIQLTSSQLVETEILPNAFVKTLLYPGAIVNALIKGTQLPNYNDILEIYSMSHVTEAPSALHLKHLEILAGSYLSVAGAIVGLLHRSRLSLFGMLLLLWGLIKEAFRQKATYLDGSATVQVFPVMLVVVFIALLCIKGDVKQILRSFQAHSSATAATILQEHIRKRRKEREMKRLEWTVNYIGPAIPRNTKVAQTGITNTL
ncbi:uncharacterized protein LOC141610826 [Silene latifolia]|uniref:uncharacterized protein LOC141610826 n=1 Tax=Silene latifolia TaxID=37657 RepID=UPI003D770448